MQKRRRYNVEARRTREREALKKILEEARGNIAEAARIAKTNYDTTYKKIKRLGLIDYAAALRRWSG